MVGKEMTSISSWRSMYTWRCFLLRAFLLPLWHIRTNVRALGWLRPLVALRLCRLAFGNQGPGHQKKLRLLQLTPSSRSGRKSPRRRLRARTISLLETTSKIGLLLIIFFAPNPEKILSHLLAQFFSRLSIRGIYLYPFMSGSDIFR